MSNYIVSARKYRPDSFSTLVGQDSIARTLKNSIVRGQLAHAYLFCGPRGVGKTSAARIFAKTINCSNPGPDMDPCGECESCQSFKEGRSYCIYELDAASNNGVEDIKSLMDKVQIPPQVGRYSVYIIDEVHMLSAAAFNAFLKTLEEPPAHAIFILCTTEKHKVLPTILSRCQTYDFNRISIPDIVKNLQSIADNEGVDIDSESLHVIARKADGAMRDALTIFDQTVAFCGNSVKYEDVIRNLNVLDYEYGFKMVDAFLKADYATAMLLFDEILSKGFNALYFLGDLGEHFRNLLVARTGGMDSLLDFPDSLKTRYSRQGAACSVKFLFDALSAVSQCEAGYRTAVNQRLHIEFTLMKLAFIGGIPDFEVKITADVPAKPVPAKPVAAQKPVSAQPETAPQPAPAPVAASAAQPEPASAVEVAPQPAPAPVAASAAQPEPASAIESAVQPEPDVPTAQPAMPETKPEVSSQAVDMSAIEEKIFRKRTPKTGSSLSLSALLSEDLEVDIKLAEPEACNEIPSDKEIIDKWPELAKGVSDSRLINTLINAKVEIHEEEGAKTVAFYVANAAQKQWIESRILHELENSLRTIHKSDALKMQVMVTPAEAEEKVPYMPVEKARDLMEKNEDFRELVKDLELDI